MGVIVNLFSALARKLTPAEVDQNFSNIKTELDKLGGYTASQAPVASQIPVTKADKSIALQGSIEVAMLSHPTTDTSSAHLRLKAPADTRELVAGFDTTDDFAYLQARQGGNGFKALRINPLGGDVVVPGSLLVGVTSTTSGHVLSKGAPSGSAVNIINTSATSPYGLQLVFSAVSGGSGGAFLSAYDGATRFNVLGNGNVQNVNNSYGAISDAKLKENVEPARSYLDDLCDVRVVRYSLVAEAVAAPTHLGVIAQELEQIFPGMVEETRDTAVRESGRYEQMEITPAVMDGEVMVSPPIYGDDITKPIMEHYETGETTKSVKYSVFVPMLVTAVQELKTKNAALEARLSALESR